MMQALARFIGPVDSKAMSLAIRISLAVVLAQATGIAAAAVYVVTR